MNVKRFLSAMVAVAIILIASGCAGRIYGVKDAIESAEARGDVQARDDHYKSSVLMIAKARTYQYGQFALYDVNNASLGIIAREGDDIAVVYIPEIQTMLAGKEGIAYDLYYLAVLGPVDKDTGKGTAVLMADEPDSPPKVIASVDFIVPQAIRGKVNEMDIGNKTLPCPVYDSAVAEETFGTYEASDANIAAVKNAKAVGDIDFKKLKVQKKAA